MTSTPAHRAAERQTEAKNATRKLAALIGPDTIIHTRTDYGRGERDHVRVYVVRPDSDTGRLRIADVSYYVARAAGLRITDRGIVMGGGQYDKGLEVAEVAWKAAVSGWESTVDRTRATGVGFDQDRSWQEIH